MTAIHELTENVKRTAIELGFARVGVTTPDAIEGYEDELLRRSGYDLWNVADPTSKLRTAPHPLQEVPGVKSVISLVRAVEQIAYPEKLLDHAGRIYLSRSYLPPDDTLEGKRVLLFEEYLREQGIQSLYDHTNMQLVDRAYAARAGVITYGRNNFAYAGEHGSFIVIVTIPVDTELECEVHEPQRPCPPDCRMCIDACPTGAMAEDGAFNPTRCVLYGNFRPGEFKDTAITDLIGMRVHGCDACQVACPRNKRAGAPESRGLVPRLARRSFLPGRDALLRRRLLQGLHPADHVQLHPRPGHLPPERRDSHGQQRRRLLPARAASRRRGRKRPGTPLRPARDRPAHELKAPAPRGRAKRTGARRADAPPANPPSWRQNVAR